MSDKLLPNLSEVIPNFIFKPREVNKSMESVRTSNNSFTSSVNGGFGLSTARALKRIFRDYEEIQKNPLTGVGISKSFEDDFKFYVNMQILHGIYEGLIFQLEMTIPHSYPVNPPKMRIMPNQPFDHEFHHHIFPDKGGYQKFCIDLLDNVFMDTKANKTGWSAAYTFRSIFMQIQNFLADPDFGGNNPSESRVQWLRQEMEKYKMSFKDEHGEMKTHTVKSPFPALGKEESHQVQSEEQDASQMKLFQIREKLTCFFTKNDILSDKEIILGYPVSIRLDFKQRPEPFPIPEILSYEGYVSEIMANPHKLDDFIGVTFKTAMGDAYNYWFPIYINEEHYQRAKTVILNSFSVLKYGPSGAEEFDFKPELILEIMPAILNKMIVFIMIGEKHMSQAALEAYGQYLLLFKRLLEDFPELKKDIKNMVSALSGGPSALNKKNLPDIGNFLVLLSFSDVQFSDKDLFLEMIKEFQCREIFWLFESPTTKEQMKNEIYQILEKDQNIIDFLDNKEERIKELNHKIQLLRKNLDKKFWKKFSQIFFFEDNVEFSDEFFAKPPQFTTKDESEYWEKLKHYYEEIKRTEKILNKSDDKVEFDKYFSKYYQNNRIMLFEKCSEETKQKITHHLYKKKNGILHFTITACRKFINPAFIEKLTKNLGIIEDQVCDEFLTYIRSCKTKITSYTQMMAEIGLPEYYDKINTEFVRFIKAIIRSNKQGYTRIFIPDFIQSKYQLDGWEMEFKKFYNSKRQDGRYSKGHSNNHSKGYCKNGFSTGYKNGQSYQNKFTKTSKESFVKNSNGKKFK